MNPQGEKAPLLPSHAGQNDASSLVSSPKQAKMNFVDALLKAVVNPPTMTMVAAAVIACVSSNNCSVNTHELLANVGTAGTLWKIYVYSMP